MDALLRVRVLIWVLVLTLWGVMVYQFLGEEESGQAQTQMQPVLNPYSAKAPPVPESAEKPPPNPSEIEAQARLLAAQTPPPDKATPEEPSAMAGGPPAENRPSSLDFIRPLTPEITVAPPPRRRGRRMRRESRLAHEAPLKIPPGFVKNVSRHFVIYSEGDAVSEQFVSLAENLHGNLMLDLAAFSPWASDEKVTIILCKSQDTYREVTGRPAWSGGASSVVKRLLYIYESNELPGILAHELCHIYYDGFYLEGRPDPLWLSEGMATLIQVERGLAAPEWLRDNMQIIEKGGGYTIDELMSVTSTSGASDDKVRLWYAQSYSLVRFLIRSQYRASFYKFSAYLRDGKDPTQALYRAYGMPYNRLKALDYAWRYDLTNSSLSKLSRGDR
ncbi:MAG: hypothetical protein HY077_10680 [Elusimicrobia bacterium]|nr:hypothetical protein [Elusimicrobiota bacterium]